jgi:hypothetical protein
MPAERTVCRARAAVANQRDLMLSFPRSRIKLKRAQASDDIGEIFFKIVTVVGVVEWVCLALWFLYSSLSRLHT